MFGNSIQCHNSSEPFILVDGWLSPVKKLLSPNANQRPDIDDVSLLVIHNISLPPEQFGDAYIEHFFCNQLDASRHPYFREIASLLVSAHFLITRKGELIQFVSTQERAWHAGQSHFGGRDNCNDFSIGIELEGADRIPYSKQQYQTLADVTKVLMNKYPQITQQRIVGHSAIAPDRKTDPGEAFDWKKYYSMLDAVCMENGKP